MNHLQPFLKLKDGWESRTAKNTDQPCLLLMGDTVKKEHAPNFPKVMNWKIQTRIY